MCKDCTSNLCELKGGQCIFKAGEDDLNLYAGTKQFKWKDLEDNGLKPTGNQNIKANIQFKAGADIDTLTVNPAAEGDCSFASGVLCENVALKNIPQTFTGTNSIDGSAAVTKDINVGTGLNVDGNVAGVDISNVYTDTLLKDHTSLQVVSGKKTLTKQLAITNLVTNDNPVTNGAETLATCPDDTVLRSASDVNIAGDLHFGEKIEAVKFGGLSTTTWDGVTLDNFETNLLVNDRDQDHTGDLMFSADVTISKGLLKSSAIDAVATINGADICYLDEHALRISGVSDVPTNLASVEFDEFGVTHDAGISVDGTFLGVDLSGQAVTKTVSQKLVMDVDHDFTGLIFTTKDVTNLVGDFANLAGTEKIVQNELWNFLNGDSSVKKVQLSHPDGGTALNEPAITKISSTALSDLKSKHWHKDVQAAIPYSMSFNKVTVDGILKADHLDSTTWSLVDWRDNYLSLSRDQTVTGAYTYAGGLTVNGELSTNYVFIGDKAGNEGLLKTETGQHKFLDHYFKVWFRITI